MGNDACKPVEGTARMRVFPDTPMPVASDADDARDEARFTGAMGMTFLPGTAP